MEVTLEQVADISLLREAWEKVRKKKSAGGLDGVTVADFEKRSEKELPKLSGDLLKGVYTPEPLQSLSVEKRGTDEKRTLGLPSLKDKIVQAALARLFSDLYEPVFSNHSYAYRRGKGTIKAVNRVRDFVQRKNPWALTMDIDDYFDSVDHDKCIGILSEGVRDERVIRLVRLYLASGAMRLDRWEDTTDGIPQGGVLSPVLSNIYLDGFDKSLEEKALPFVRYADNIVMLGAQRELLEEHASQACCYLKENLGLEINEPKTRARHVNEGFSFLGIFFHRESIKIDYKRVDEKIERIKDKLDKTSGLQAGVSKVTEFFSGIDRYYGKLLENSSQLNQLETGVLAELSSFIAKLKAKGTVKTKKECREVLSGLGFIGEKSPGQKQILVDKIVEDAFARDFTQEGKAEPAAGKGQSVGSAIGKKRQQYARKLATETELFVSIPGCFVGSNKRMFTVKEKGRIIASIPKNRLKRVVVASMGVAFSSNFVRQCSQRNIAVEFLKCSIPF